MTRMTKVAVLEGRCGTSDKGCAGGQLQRVEQPRPIAPDDHSPGLKILHGTIRVKLNR